MRKYLEATEIVEANQEAEFIRADITDKTEQETTAIRQAIEDVMKGLVYTLSKHYCYHDEGGSCRVELI